MCLFAQESLDYAPPFPASKLSDSVLQDHARMRGNNKLPGEAFACDQKTLHIRVNTQYTILNAQYFTLDWMCFCCSPKIQTKTPPTLLEFQQGEEQTSFLPRTTRAGNIMQNKTLDPIKRANFFQQGRGPPDSGAVSSHNLPLTHFVPSQKKLHIEPLR